MAKLWNYSDYETLTDPTARLARLRLHIDEISQHHGGFKSRTGAKFPPAYQIWLELKKEAAELSGTFEKNGLGQMNAPIRRIRTRQRRV